MNRCRLKRRPSSSQLETALAERRNMSYASTLVTYGQGRGVVVAIGAKTEVGRISELISTADVLETPLTRKIAKFSRLLLVVILLLAAVTFAVGVWRGQSKFEMFMAAVALAVGAIPEGLPAAVTITLAIGVARMARRRAIIRKLPAVETLGSTTVICSDKTGTLTVNQMTVREIWAGGQLFTTSGTGYEPTGEIQAEGDETITLSSNVAASQCLLAGCCATIPSWCRANLAGRCMAIRPRAHCLRSRAKLVWMASMPAKHRLAWTRFPSSRSTNTWRLCTTQRPINADRFM